MTEQSTPTSKQRFRTLRRTTTTGAVLVAAYMMFLMAPGGGGGAGDTRREPDSEKSPATVKLSAAANSAANTAGTPNPLTSPLAAPASVLTAGIRQNSSSPPVAVPVIEGGVLTLVVDEHEYFVRLPKSSDEEDAKLRHATLNEIAAHLAAATGDSNGIRVRILRRDTARASAEAKLQTMLRESGVHADAVYMAEELLP